MFGQPVVLVLLAIPLLMLGWVWTRSGRRMALPFDHAIGRSSPSHSV